LCRKRKNDNLFWPRKARGKSKLWPRLRKSENWSLLKNEFEKLKSRKNSPLNNFLSDSMVSRLTGGELILIAWIATLIAAVFFYAIYKNRRIKLKINKDGEVELEIEPNYTPQSHTWNN